MKYKAKFVLYQKINNKVLLTLPKMPDNKDFKTKENDGIIFNGEREWQVIDWGNYKWDFVEDGIKSEKLNDYFWFDKFYCYDKKKKEIKKYEI